MNMMNLLNLVQIDRCPIDRFECENFTFNHFKEFENAVNSNRCFSILNIPEKLSCISPAHRATCAVGRAFMSFPPTCTVTPTDAGSEGFCNGTLIFA